MIHYIVVSIRRICLIDCHEDSPWQKDINNPTPVFMVGYLVLVAKNDIDVEEEHIEKKICIQTDYRIKYILISLYLLVLREKKANY